MERKWLGRCCVCSVDWDWGVEYGKVKILVLFGLDLARDERVSMKRRLRCQETVKEY